MKKLKKVLLLGSGALKIGEAGEFDYSGSQALKALRQEGVSSVLINPNIATIQTSKDMADKIYFLPVTPHFVEEVIKKERPDGILLSFGGQTALNCGLQLDAKGVLKKYNVQVLGTSVATIRDTEDRDRFKKKLKELNLKTPESIAVSSTSQALAAGAKISYPVIIRGAFSLGGHGSAVAKSERELKKLAAKALATTSQILVEKYLMGWKEIEYEVVRDGLDNSITVCNMENLDPMGIHTGESIVVAPSQTLTQKDYFRLREISITCIKGLGIVGECNIQFAFDPKTSDYRIIEVNARLSRSSALASKATGYPLAFVAAKIALGFTLPEIKNSVTKKTSAFFEPSLDYLVIKMPRWDLKKLKHVTQTIGSEMKSVGEVMAIGRSFPECIQKATRMIGLGHEGVVGEEYLKQSLPALEKQLRSVTPERIFILTAALIKGISLAHAHRLTQIDYWFLAQIKKIGDMYKELSAAKKITPDLLKNAKQYGFSDEQVANIFKTKENTIRTNRKRWNILPVVKQIDTLAGEFPAETNYLYMTYHGDFDDVHFSKKKRVAVLGGGPYHIGSSVEFDWCAVNTAKTLSKLGKISVMINCNPETVSTDYDTSDTLCFEELTLERVLDIWDKNCFESVILSVGGQIPNNLAHSLHKAGVKILGTHPKNIDRAENRHTFSKTLDSLGIKQPPWRELSNNREMFSFASKVGFPLLIRPSYVLSGTSMTVVYTREDIEEFLRKNDKSWGYPIVVSKFITDAKELDFDGVAKNGKIIAAALSEHVEEGGVHSGDATLVLPPQAVHIETARKIREVTTNIAKSFAITGPFNIQFLAKEGNVWVIECNLRASRSFPFCSKVLKSNFIEMATKAILNVPTDTSQSEWKLFNKQLDYIGVKAPQFSFGRLRGADPVLRVEMASTGEVGTLGETLEDAYLKAYLAVGNTLPKKSILLTLGGETNKQAFLDQATVLAKLGYMLYATQGTSEFLTSRGIAIKRLYKAYEQKSPNVLDYIAQKKIDLVIILSDKPDVKEKRKQVKKELTDGYHMRRVAADVNIPIITNANQAKLFVRALTKLKSVKNLSITEWK